MKLAALLFLAGGIFGGSIGYFSARYPWHLLSEIVLSAGILLALIIGICSSGPNAQQQPASTEPAALPDQHQPTAAGRTDP